MFLDNVTRTIEISLGKAYDFNKPYSQYLNCVMKFAKAIGNTKKIKQKKEELKQRKTNRELSKATKASWRNL
jgi:ATP-binding cassette subfamily F protein 3